MLAKLKEKQKAIRFRKRGFSYSEILKKVPVAKSTLSLWLRTVGLAKRQKQRLTEKRLAAILRGGETKRRQRIERTKKIKQIARAEIKTISKKELWLMGIMLYWAEGAKQKATNPSQKVQFSNSDVRMIKVYLKWLYRICKIPLKNIDFEIYIHETANIEEAKKYWAETLNLSEDKFQKVRLKRHKINTKRKNIGRDYHGLLSVTVKRSTNLNREITGWIEGICKNCRVV